MRHQLEYRTRKQPIIVDEDCGVPTSVIEQYRANYDSGPLGPSDPRTFVLSMSEYDKPQTYDVYDYPAATRSEQAPDYATFATHPQYTTEYVGTQAQVPSGLPHSTGLSLLPPAQQYAAHDPTYYNQQHAQYPAYLASAPRQLPEIISYTPNQGRPGQKVTVYFRSIYDLDAPHVSIVIMFGHKRCDSVLSKTAQQGSTFHYALSSDAPSLEETNSASPKVPLHLILEGPVEWVQTSLDFGEFTFLDQPNYHAVDSPTQSRPSAKRKLSPEAGERRSPTKKPSMHQLSGPSKVEHQPYLPSVPLTATEFTRPVVSEAYSQTRRFSGPEYAQSYGQGLPRVQPQQYYAGQPASATPRLQTAQSPYGYYQSLPSTTRSPSAATLPAGSKTSQLLPSPAGSTNPPLIRTSTLQQSPTTPAASSASTTQTFNPYAMYPSNTKAMLKIDGELNSMADSWSPAEWEVKRRLVQFRRSQTGSVITATFEGVSLEDRIPNSICVSCIWWEEKQACYVTSVDTISLLESLVAVRFTVEEKNRIRRNLEGFRPETVSKTKPDSEEFFKLIMGFPNPKPRNIEKDVKVFPWRILATALKKIIGKYASHSASYSSTAGALHAPGALSYTASRASDAGVEPQRPAASPRSTSSSATSHGHAYANTMTSQAFAPQAAGSAGLGMGQSQGQPDLRLAVPVSAAAQTTSWHQPSAHYSSDLSGTGRPSWDFGSYLHASPATGLPSSAQSAHYQYQQRMPSLTSQAAMPVETRFVPLHDYEDQSHQTSSS